MRGGVLGIGLATGHKIDPPPVRVAGFEDRKFVCGDKVWVFRVSALCCREGLFFNPLLLKSF
jgi:hypothetical protein